MKRTLRMALLVLVIGLTSGCISEMVTSGDYTLKSGQTVRGDLLVTSGNVTLEEGSRVRGRVVMTSGNLVANGEIDGDVFLTSGNGRFGPNAVVRGDITATSGTIKQEEGTRIDGTVSTSGFPGGIVASLLAEYCLLPLIVLGGFVYLFVISFRRKRPTAKRKRKREAAQEESLTERLGRLQDLLERGLITEEEYEAKKAEILADL